MEVGAIELNKRQLEQAFSLSSPESINYSVVANIDVHQF